MNVLSKRLSSKVLFVLVAGTVPLFSAACGKSNVGVKNLPVASKQEVAKVEDTEFLFRIQKVSDVAMSQDSDLEEQAEDKDEDDGEGEDEDKGKDSDDTEEAPTPPEDDEDLTVQITTTGPERCSETAAPAQQIPVSNNTKLTKKFNESDCAIEATGLSVRGSDGKMYNFSFPTGGLDVLTAGSSIEALSALGIEAVKGTVKVFKVERNGKNVVVELRVHVSLPGHLPKPPKAPKSPPLSVAPKPIPHTINHIDCPDKDRHPNAPRPPVAVPVTLPPVHHVVGTPGSGGVQVSVETNVTVNVN
jgi:hypothetical protein